MNEATCSCQHCTGHIAFDPVHAGSRADCPHCGLETILFIPKVQARAIPNYEPNAPPPPDKTNYGALGTMGIIFSILIPFIGFFIGIYLLLKGQSGRGTLCIAMSIAMVILVVILVVILMNS